MIRAPETDARSRDLTSYLSDPVREIQSEARGLLDAAAQRRLAHAKLVSSGAVVSGLGENDQTTIFDKPIHYANKLSIIGVFCIGIILEAMRVYSRRHPIW